MKRLLFTALIAALVPVALVASCKQGEGQRCQVDDDCESGLVCAQATHLCATSETSGGIDALPPVDAPAEASPEAAVAP